MDAFCLAALIREARAILPGARISRVVQPDRWSLALMFHKGPGPRGLLLSVEPGAPRVEILSPPRDIPHTPSRFGDLMTSRAKGGQVETVEQLDLERIVAVHLKGCRPPEDALTLYAEMLGSRGNVVLVDRATGTMIDRLRSSPAHARAGAAGPGEPYRPPLDHRRVDPRSTGEEAFVERIRPLLAAGMEPSRILMTCFTGFSQQMASDVVGRSTLLPQGSLMERGHSLWTSFSDTIGRVTAGQVAPRVIVDGEGRPVALAAFPLVTVPADRQVPYGSMSEAAHAYYADRDRAAGREALRAGLLRRLNREMAAADRLSAKLTDEAALYGHSERYERTGQLLLAHRATIRRGDRMIELPDYADTGQGVLQIELDPAHSVEENAKRYFALHRKAKRGAEIVNRRLAAVTGRLTSLQGLVRETEGARGLDELQRIEAALAPIERPRVTRDRAAAAVRKSDGPEPRAFRSSDGLSILVGKSGAGNDRLTWRLARSHDLWLHAQGFPGSHVLVRLEKGKPVPPRTLREAAQIAAYYSRARGQVKVPVDYALRKYLRKPKAASAGAVLVTQEKTIVVRPDPDLVRRLHPAGRDPLAEG